MEGTYLLTMRCPAYRRHDSYLGFRTEPENRVGDDKGKGTSEPHEAESTDAPIRGALPRTSEEAKGAGYPRQDGVNGKPEEFLYWQKPGRASLGWHEPDEARVSCPDL